MAKVSKEAAQYSLGMADRRCANCQHFVRPNRCEIVEGEIRPGK